MREGYTIRRGCIDDVERIAEILCSAWLFAYADIVPAEMMVQFTDRPQRIQRLRETWNSDNLMLVAVNGEGLVCGFAIECQPCRLDDYDAEISSLYVHPSYSRSGIGGALMRAMGAAFLSRGLKSMAIRALSQNEIGCAFYAKHGGRRGAEDEWNGLPCIWFVWGDLEA